jgi:glutamate carboxypeptidase
VIGFGAAADAHREWLLEGIKALVRAESPSTDRASLDACAEVLSRCLVDAGASIERLPGGATADMVLARWPGDGPAVLLLGHFDTVWPVGQIERMPLRVADGRLFGPGVLDMKAGLAIAALAARVVCAGLPADRRPQITLLATADEEVGSTGSRAAIERLARESAAVLVFEPALPGGAVKTARKGVGEFEVALSGVSSHAGAAPHEGASAIVELARVVLALQALNDPARGVSVNVGVVDGGTRSNVVAERARAVVDVRIAAAEDGAAIESAINGLRPSDSRVRIGVRGAINRPPMVRTTGVAKLYDLARAVASDLGQTLGEGATGGASDGNFTAALGVPTLDGLGAVGDGPHALHEHVVIESLTARAALVAGLIARIGQMR